MKKRLLALALCLVMATSLLPMTAYGENPEFGVYITGTGFEMSDGSNYVLKGSQLKVYFPEDINIDEPFSGGSQGLYQDETASIPVTNGLVDGKTYYFKYQISGDKFALSLLFNHLGESNCSLVIPGYTAHFIGKSGDSTPTKNVVFQVTKDYDWQFTQTDSTLTATCKNCDTSPVTLSLSAHSVTLPDSPFNAQLAGEKEFQAAFPNAAISKIRYDYKGSDGVWHKGVDPVSANAKAGEYQAFVEISNLPRPVEYDGVVAMAENPDGTYTADLFVKYTAVDPAVTAQTGDNRPIELMMGSVLVFSALAAAAFILDNRRKYSR